MDNLLQEWPERRPKEPPVPGGRSLARFSEAADFFQLPRRALGVRARLLARLQAQGILEQQGRTDVRREARLRLGQRAEQLVERLQRDVELEMLALDLLLQVERGAEPGLAAPAARRVHVGGERVAARGGLLREARGVAPAPHDLARAGDGVLGRVGELGLARRLQRAQVAVDAGEDLLRRGRGERLAELRGRIADERRHRALLLERLVLAVHRVADERACDGQDGDQERSSKSHFLSKASMSSAGTGRLKRKPCAWSQRSSRSSCACCSVSTPSATTLRRSAWASEMMVPTMLVSCGFSVIPCTKPRSILSVSSGSRLR